MERMMERDHPDAHSPR